MRLNADLLPESEIQQRRSIRMQVNKLGSKLFWRTRFGTLQWLNEALEQRNKAEVNLLSTARLDLRQSASPNYRMFRSSTDMQVPVWSRWRLSGKLSFMAFSEEKQSEFRQSIEYQAVLAHRGRNGIRTWAALSRDLSLPPWPHEPGLLLFRSPFILLQDRLSNGFISRDNFGFGLFKALLEDRLKLSFTGHYAFRQNLLTQEFGFDDQAAVVNTAKVNTGQSANARFALSSTQLRLRTVQDLEADLEYWSVPGAISGNEVPIKMFRFRWNYRLALPDWRRISSRLLLVQHFESYDGGVDGRLRMEQVKLVAGYRWKKIQLSTSPSIGRFSTGDNGSRTAALMDASMSYKPENSNWEWSLLGYNLLNENRLQRATLSLPFVLEERVEALPPSFAVRARLTISRTSKS